LQQALNEGRRSRIARLPSGGRSDHVRDAELDQPDDDEENEKSAEGPNPPPPSHKRSATALLGVHACATGPEFLLPGRKTRVCGHAHFRVKPRRTGERVGVDV
jgi:hypothetical protein